MEVKINREIRNYTESMFFGLSMRQFIFSVLACGVAVGLYFAVLGFITYHGMTAEQFIWAWLRSEIIEPKEIRFESSNLYYEALKDTIESREKGGAPAGRSRKKRKGAKKEAKHD